MAQGIYPSRVVPSNTGSRQPAFRAASAAMLHRDPCPVGFSPDPPFVAVQQTVVSL